VRIDTSKPSTVFIKFTGNPLPRTFVLKNAAGEIYFFRQLDGKTPRIKFNLPHSGSYGSTTSFSIEKITDIIIKDPAIVLPPYERDRIKDFTIVFNPELSGPLATPARVFTNEGIVEKGANLYKFPKPMRVFFLLHEVGHFYYKTEQYCDLFAFVHFVRMGYNASTAIYCLTKVLKDSPLKTKRVQFIYDQLHSNGFTNRG